MHALNNVYQEAPYSWAIVCTCGWKEKAQTEREARARFVAHRRTPHKF